MIGNPTRREFLGLGATGVASAMLARLEAEAAQFVPPAGKMPTRVLGKTGVRVSILALGGQSAATDFPSDELAAKFINDCIDAGINYLDTAPVYSFKGDPRNSERRFGRAIAHRRDDVYLATKTMKRSADEALRDIETSLKLLQTDHLDCLQVHCVDPKEDLARLGKPDGVYTLLRKLRDQKVIRFIGVTTHLGADVLKQAIEMYEFDTVLTTFNPTKERRPYEELFLPAAQKQNLGLVAMKTMGGASRYDHMGLTGVPGRLVGNDPGRASPERLLRYALSLPIHTATSGMRDYAQLRENLEVCYHFKPLDDVDRRALQVAMNDSHTLLAYNKPGYCGA
jgi:predicted aldo/keto reductase-like oxidoreductase